MPNIHKTVAQLKDVELLNKFEANFQSNDFTTILNTLEPVPTGWNTKVENPGDKKLTKKERRFNTELARKQGGAPSYAQVSQGADLNVSPNWIYSKGEK